MSNISGFLTATDIFHHFIAKLSAMFPWQQLLVTIENVIKGSLHIHLERGQGLFQDGGWMVKTASEDFE